MKNRIHILGAAVIVAVFSTAQAQSPPTAGAPAQTTPPASNPVIAPAPAGAQAPATTTTPAVPSTGTTAVVLPAGTPLLVRLTDGVSSAAPAGTRFATTLDHDIAGANGTVALKAGTVIYGTVASSTQARRAVGQSTLDLRLSQISAGSQQIPIQTTGFQQAGERSGRKAARGAAAGAGIGAIAGNAGVGAAAGALAGGMRRGQTVDVPPGSLLEFTLTQPVTIQR